MTSDILRTDAHAVADALGDGLQRLSGTTLLVTGAAGFLCAYLCDVLAVISRERLEKPIRLLAMDNYLRGVPDRLAYLADDPNVRLIRHDVTQPFDPGEKVDWIIHGASIASPTFYRQYPIETIDANVVGTRHMLDLARQGASSMIFLSSSEIYGDPAPDAIPTPETYWGHVSCTGPRACYDESKRLGETLCVAYHQRHGVPVKMVRPFNVYGPGQRLDDRRLVPDFMSAALKGDPIVLLSDGRATRSFCYAGDFTAGMLLVMLSDRQAEPFNVGNDVEISIADAARIMAGVAGDVPLPVEFRVSDDPHYLTDNPQRRCPDLAKARGLGFDPRIQAAEGFRRTLDYYRQAEAGRAAG